LRRARRGLHLELLDADDAHSEAALIAAFRKRPLGVDHRPVALSATYVTPVRCI